MTMRKFLIFLLLLKSANALAQRITEDRIEWTVNKLQDLTSATETAYSCRFVTGPGTLRWEQKEVVTNFSMLSTAGTWPAISQDGKTVFTAVDAGSQVRLTFERQNGQITILMELTEPQKRYRFTVSQTRIL